MESQQNPPSVLAGLMGLGEAVLQQPIKKQKSQRVLSENYLRRVSSIGCWEHRSFSKQRKLRAATENIKHQKSTEQGNSTLHQKMEGSLNTDLSSELQPADFRSLLEPRFRSKTRACPFNGETVVLKEKPRKMENVILLPNVLQLPEDQKKQNPEKTGKQVRLGLTGGDKGRVGTQSDALSVSDRRSLNRNCIGDYTIFKSYPVGISSGNGSSNISRLGYSAATDSTKTRMGKISFHKYWWMDKSPTHSINLEKLRSRKRSSSDEVGVEVKNSFNWHLRETTCQSLLFQKSETGQSAHEKSGIPDSMLNFRNMSPENATITEPSKHDAAFSGSSSSCAVQQVVLLEDGEDLSFKNQTFVDRSQTPNSSISSTGCVELAAPVVVNKRNVFVHESAKNHKIHNKDLVSSDFSWGAELAESSSCVSQVSNQQEDSTAEVSEESSIASYYSSVDHESLGNFDVSHSSPVSVLEASFEGGISSFSEWFANVNPNMCDIKVNAKVLESSEAGSEWSEVIVSSDDEVEGRTGGHPGDNELIKWFKIEESRDFSYMVDVLMEAGFHEMGSWKWYSTDSPTNPSVFDVLEKKYGDKKCWRRSERRLFFDRVNLALMKSLQPWLGFPTWESPAAGRLGVLQIEEKVWKLLSDQEKEARTMGSPSEKALGTDDGCYLGYDIEEIAREMEDSLVEDLVSDFIRA